MNIINNNNNDDIAIEACQDSSSLINDIHNNIEDKSEQDLLQMNIKVDIPKGKIV